jgi:hypothetical protein
MSISNVAIIVRPTMSAWSGQVLDKAAGHELDVAKSTKAQAYKVQKTLLPGATGVELKMLWAVMNDTRSYIYNHTLRWINRGELLLPLSMFIGFEEEINEREERVRKAFDLFLGNYLHRQQEAAQLLGTGYNPNDYPSTDQLRQGFKFAVPALPVPDHNQLARLIGEDKAAATDALIQEGVQSAMKDAYERVYEVVKHAKEKLSDPKAIFRDSLVENIKELAGVLPAFNIANDPLLAELAVELQDIGTEKPEELRDSPYRRSDVAQRAQAMLDKMSGLNLNV